jgi:hypothetical protein
MVGKAVCDSGVLGWMPAGELFEIEGQCESTCPTAQCFLVLVEFFHYRCLLLYVLPVNPFS